MCSTVHITQGNSNPSCLWNMISRRIVQRNIILLFWCSVRRGAAARISTTLAVWFKIYWISNKFCLPVENILDQTKFGHKGLSTCRGRKLRHRTNVRGEDRSTITGSLKLDKRNHGRGAIVFINCIITEVLPTPCRILGTCDQAWSSKAWRDLWFQTFHELCLLQWP